MYPTSAAFKKAVRKSHRAITRAEVWSGDQKLLDLDVKDGSVDVDSTRSIRRTCQLTAVSDVEQIQQTPVFNTYADMTGTYATLAVSKSSYGELIDVIDWVETTLGDTLVPDTAFDALTPFGNELRLWRGVETVTETVVFRTYAELMGMYATYGDMTGTYGSLISSDIVTSTSEELVPLGVFGMTDVEVERSGDGLRVSLSGMDRGNKIARARWTNVYQVTKGQNVADAISDLLANRMASVETQFVATTAYTGGPTLGTETDNDPWRDAIKLAESAGLELFFDGNGVAVLRESRDYATATPDAVYAENSEAMILSLRRRLTSERTYNGVVAISEGTEVDPFRVEVWDTDPTSPTYVYGNFGQVPFFYSSPLLQTTEQATAAAVARLEKVKGVVESVDWTQIVDPSLDVGDVIAVYNSDTKIKRLMVLDKLTIPLNPSQPMTAVARTVRVLAGEMFFDEVDAA